MALTFTELQAITNDYFLADNGKAFDIFFYPSFFVNYFMDKKKGIWKRPNGGKNIRIPLEYDEAEGGFYSRGDSVSSDDRTAVNAAYFGWKHAYGNATIYRTDELENAGEEAEVEIVAQRIAGAQKKCTKDIAGQIYNNATDSAKEITGLLSLASTSTTVAYGNIQEADLVASDGTYPWKGRTTTTTEAISLAAIRTLRSTAKIGDGPQGRPNVGLTTETLYNVVSGILQAQQRFTSDSDTAKAGFENLVFEGMIISPDDYCPSGYFFGLNDKYIGFAVHATGFFEKTPWADLITAGVVGKSMKVFWDGNIVCSNRKSHIAHSNLS